jgi:2'-5' RNA ligase
MKTQSMRLFIALRPDDAAADCLCGYIDSLRAVCERGNFTRRENLHLTLAFFGETDRLEDIRHAMDETRFPAPRLSISGMGRFSRSANHGTSHSFGDIWWAGVNAQGLNELRGGLCAALRARSVPFDGRSFRAHITLGREVTLRAGADAAALGSLPGVPMTVGSISLMRSQRMRGRLVYTEIYSRPMAGPLG